MKHFLAVVFLLFSQLIFAETEGSVKRSDSIRESVYEIGKLEQKDLSIVDDFKNMFKDGEVSGQVRIAYAGYDFKNADPDTYATAVGGILKYELAKLNGFNAGVAFYTSKDMQYLSGSGDKRNTELSSSEGVDHDMSEVYINYEYQELNVRLGRQVLDTPLADSDDIRMIQNTFEAYIASYEKGGWNLSAGHISQWHGIDLENGLDDGWTKTGTEGVNFAGAKYYDMWEWQSWYYNITGMLNALYIDLGVEYPVSELVTLHMMGQYLNQQELNDSGYGATIYGGLFEVVVGDFGMGLTYNKAVKQNDKESFSGFGGCTLFTNMDMMILDNITKDREVNTFVGGMGYNFGDISFLYAYGDFAGKADSQGEKTHIVEQNFNAEYNVNDEFLVALIYVNSRDKQNSIKTEYDYDRVQFLINYNF